MDKLKKIAEILKSNLGREELTEWWLLTINQKLQAYGGLKLNNRQMAQYFKMLKGKFSISRRVYSFSDDSKAIFYKVGKAKK